MADDDRRVGQLIDNLGITHTLDDDDLVAGAVTILKVIDSDGDVRLAVAWSDGMSWIERLGMLRAAERLDLPNPADAHE